MTKTEAANATACEGALSSPVSSASEKQRVLVVDDEQDVVVLVSSALRREGFLVSSADDGEKAAAMAASAKPALIVLDLMLPGISGVELCRKLKRDPATADVKIIILSARAEVDVRLRCIEAGAAGYVTKPFSPKELARLVKETLAN